MIAYRECCPYRLGRSGDRSAHSWPGQSEGGMTKCSAATRQEDTATPRNYRHEYEGSEQETTKNYHQENDQSIRVLHVLQYIKDNK